MVRRESVFTTDELLQQIEADLLSGWFDDLDDAVAEINAMRKQSGRPPLTLTDEQRQALIARAGVVEAERVQSARSLDCYH